MSDKCFDCGDELFYEDIPALLPGRHHVHDRETCLKNQLKVERQRRIYYQDIVYSVCNQLDKVFTPLTVCGTKDNPATNVQERVKMLVHNFDPDTLTPPPRGNWLPIADLESMEFLDGEQFMLCFERGDSALNPTGRTYYSYAVVTAHVDEHNSELRIGGECAEEIWENAAYYMPLSDTAMVVIGMDAQSKWWSDKYGPRRNQEAAQADER